MKTQQDQHLTHTTLASAPTPAIASRFALASLASTLLGVSCALWLGTAAGCSEPLLAARDERSPFDRYDAVRNQHAPQYVENKFGKRQPNLTGRLSPKK